MLVRNGMPGPGIYYRQLYKNKLEGWEETDEFWETCNLLKINMKTEKASTNYK